MNDTKKWKSAVYLKRRIFDAFKKALTQTGAELKNEWQLYSNATKVLLVLIYLTVGPLYALVNPDDIMINLAEAGKAVLLFICFSPVYFVFVLLRNFLQNVLNNYILIFIITYIIAFAFAFAFAGADAGAVAFAVAFAFAGAVTFAGAGAGAGAVAGAGAFAGEFAVTGTVVFAFAFAFAFALVLNNLFAVKTKTKFLVDENIRIEDELERIQTHVGRAVGTGRNVIRDMIVKLIEENQSARKSDKNGETPHTCIGLAGRRGVGKTDIMHGVQKQFYDKRSEASRIMDSIILWIHCPARYEERDFLIAFFIKMAEAVDREVRKKLTLETSREREILKARLSGIEGRINRFFLLLLVAYLGMVPAVRMFGNKRFSIAGYKEAAEFIHWKIIQLNPLPDYIFQPGVMVVIGILMIMGLFFVFSRRKKDSFKENPYFYMILEDTNEIISRLQYQMTLKESTEVSAGYDRFNMSFLAKRQRQTEKSQKPWTTVDLMNEYNRYITRVVTRLRENNKKYRAGRAADPIILVGIDEMDKIEDAKEMWGMLTRIKGLLTVGGVNYILSISEDALDSFGRRGVEWKNAVDSTFDHIFFIPPLELEYAEEVAINIFKENDVSFPGIEKTASLAAVLSGGVPRDIKRFCELVIMRRSSESDVSAAEQAGAYHDVLRAAGDEIEWFRRTLVNEESLTCEMKSKFDIPYDTVEISLEDVKEIYERMKMLIKRMKRAAKAEETHSSFIGIMERFAARLAACLTFMNEELPDREELQRMQRGIYDLPGYVNPDLLKK